MQHTTLRARMLGGEVLLGAWCSIGDMLPAEILGHAGYDWLVIDMEHGPITLAAAQAMIVAIRTTPAAAIVRVPWTGSAAIQPVLDSGPYGIVVPMVNTPTDAQAVVRDARFLPLGERSRGGIRSALAFGTDPVSYFARGNAETIVMVQTETVEAVRNADEIAALDGIDCLFVGPNDLASTYGETYPQAWEKLGGPYGDAIRSIPAIARRHGKVAGILANSAEMGRQCVTMGYTVVGISVDTSLLATAARRECTVFRGAP
jgi:4-hydroxy-2-oxoheptanedioate aldolase